MADHPRPTTVAWFHCFSGVAGDMALGSLVDAGANLAEVESLCRRLPVDGWALDAEPVLRGGIAATKIHVRVPATSHHQRTWADIRALLVAAALPDRVRERAVLVFAALARAEGALHRLPADDVHFHEVGSADAIIDVVGTCAALEVLDVDDVVCSRIAVGQGRIRAAHGVLPNPAPATVRVLAEAGAPSHGVDSPVELTTPTGAALMAGLASSFGPLPDLDVTATGFGAGGSDPDGVVNATQVVIGARSAATADTPEGSGQPVLVLEANVDDASGEVLADAVATLLAAGAHDAWITPIVMKKGRPAYTVAALVDPALAGRLARVLRAATGSFGVRGFAGQRWPVSRTTAEVEVDGHRVLVKVSAGRVKAEHDDAAVVARATGRPVAEVIARAEAAWRSRPPTTREALVEEPPATPIAEPTSSHIHRHDV